LITREPGHEQEKNHPRPPARVVHVYTVVGPLGRPISPELREFVRAACKTAYIVSPFATSAVESSRSPAWVSLVRRSSTRHRSDCGNRHRRTRIVSERDMSHGDSNSEMSSQIIPLKGRTDLRGIQPNSGHGDHSRLSCSAGDKQLGAGFCRDLQQAFYTDVGHHAASPRRHELAAISFVQKMIRPAAKQQHHCSVCAGLSAQRECVW